MHLPKLPTTGMLYPKLIVVGLFIILPIVGFIAGKQFGTVTVQPTSVINQYSQTVDNSAEKTSPPSELAQPTPAPVKSVKRTNWNRYMSSLYDYYLDYPSAYEFYADTSTQITFQKKSDEPNSSEDYIFVYTGFSTQYDEEIIKQLENIPVGKTEVAKRKNNPLPDGFSTYERLADEMIAGKEVKAYLQKKVFEFSKNTTLHLYVYKAQNNTIYTFGGLTNDTEIKNGHISTSEFKDILSTLTFLD